MEENKKYQSGDLVKNIISSFGEAEVGSTGGMIGASAGAILAALATAGVALHFGATEVGDHAINLVNWIRTLPQDAMVTASQIEGYLCQAGQQVQQGIGTFARGAVRVATALGTSTIVSKLGVSDLTTAVGAGIGGGIGKGIGAIKEKIDEREI